MNNISFVTDSKRFDSLINEFRIAGFNCRKKKVTDDLASDHVLIIDLGYSFEQAYPLLEKLRADFHYSDKIIINAISSKSELLKLRGPALGSADFISSAITFRDLKRKLEELVDPSKFLVKKQFKNLEVKISFECSISHLSENGCLVKSKTSFDSRIKALELRSRLIADLGLDDRIRFSLSRSNPGAKKGFLTEVHFLNLTDEDRLKIRQMVHNWTPA